jgi:hypothetical protein
MGRRYGASEAEPSPAAAVLAPRDEIRAVALRYAARPGAEAVQQCAARSPVAATLAADGRQVLQDVPSPAVLRDAPWQAALPDELVPPLGARPALAGRLFHAPGRTKRRLPRTWK